MLWYLKKFLWIAGSVTYGDAVNSNGIKTLSAWGLSISPVKVNTVFSDSAKSLPKNTPDFTILCN